MLVNWNGLISPTHTCSSSQNSVQEWNTSHSIEAECSSILRRYAVSYSTEQNWANRVDWVLLSSLIELNRTHWKVLVRLCSITEPIELQSNDSVRLSFGSVSFDWLHRNEARKYPVFLTSHLHWSIIHPQQIQVRTGQANAMTSILHVDLIRCRRVFRFPVLKLKTELWHVRECDTFCGLAQSSWGVHGEIGALFDLR